MTQAPHIPAPQAPPAADRATDQVLCPLCEYDLRGLAEPRCPECGYHFTWEELRDPSRRYHPYLFEHHPERNAWSFLQTLGGGLGPAEFWSTLYPTQPSRPRRLFAFWLIAAAPLALVALVHGWLLVAGLLNMLRTQFYGPRSPPEVVRWAMYTDVEAGGFGLLAVMCLAWPWLTLAALLVFQISMRRARLKSTHVLRCVLYAGDVCLWLALPAALAVWSVWAPGKWPPRTAFAELSVVTPLAAIALAVWLLFRLHTAYTLYLRFDHAGATVLASQVMVALVYWKLWLVAEGF